mgnify:CR=1 FL=1
MQDYYTRKSSGMQGEGGEKFTLLKISGLAS